MEPTYVSFKYSHLDTPSVEDRDAGTPQDDSTASILWVEVTDPTEPLYGKRFELLQVSRGPETSAVVLVRYKNDARLRLPLRATSLATWLPEGPRVTLTCSAVEELLSLVKECEPCPRPQPESGPRSERSTSRKSRKPSSRS
jgi:hypothetical protein